MRPTPSPRDPARTSRAARLGRLGAPGLLVLAFLAPAAPVAAAITEFAVPTAGSGPTGITAGPDGHLWFTEFSGNNIARLTTPAVLRLSPASGVLVSTQHFDLVLVLQAQGLAIVGGQALVGGLDVTAGLAGCGIPGTRLAGGATFRCPGLTGGLLASGVHTVSVSLTFSDGSTAADTARWQVDALSPSGLRRPTAGARERAWSGPGAPSATSGGR